MQLPSGAVSTYGYDGDGLRAWKTTGGVTTQFVYDEQKLIQEADGNGNTTATYTSTGGSVYSALVGIREGTASHFPLPDALGSVRILLDANQNWTDGYSYDAFGNAITNSGTTTNPYRYVGSFGYYLDAETGLELLTHRYYDAAVGRFLTRDPIGFEGGDWNVYGYVRSNPEGGTDPTGRLNSIYCIAVCLVVDPELYVDCKDDCDAACSLWELHEDLDAIMRWRKGCYQPSRPSDCMKCGGKGDSGNLFRQLCDQCCLNLTDASAQKACNLGCKIISGTL